MSTIKRFTEKNFKHGMDLSQYQGLHQYSMKSETPNLDFEVRKRLDQNDQITEKQFILLQEYAKFLPSGKRQLKVDLKELSALLVSEQLSKTNTLNKTSGLSSGGHIALDLNKISKLQNEKIKQFTIVNKNKLQLNPNPTSFKNNITFG
tara:strand:+ start:1883 stop:2329 length:447 start_codon:yes stop_codon:yes gene_type:complete